MCDSIVGFDSTFIDLQPPITDMDALTATDNLGNVMDLTSPIANTPISSKHGRVINIHYKNFRKFKGTHFYI